MQIWTAFGLGFVGSLHCLGMCGPLVLAMPKPAAGQAGFLTQRLLHNMGRIATYMLLGGLFGTLGGVVAWAGYQRVLCVLIGLLILLSPLVPRIRWFGRVITHWVGVLRGLFQEAWRSHSRLSMLGLGLVNGLLPCGLVYAACAGAATVGTPLEGALYMLAFGLGTLPMMLGIGLSSTWLRQVPRIWYRRLVPVGLVLMGSLLILRGAGLGIPYLSPPPAESGATCATCAESGH